jgi:hypothetical protein
MPVLRALPAALVNPALDQPLVLQAAVEVLEQ